FSLVYVLPWISIVTTCLLSFIFDNILSASLSLMISISLSLALFGSFSSVTSTSSIFAYLLILFLYSSTACTQYFSFNFPTVIKVIFIYIHPFYPAYLLIF